MALFLLISGCDTEQLAQSWQIDRLRVLAVAATPAEPRPGDVVTFDALILSPDRPLGGSAWFVCSADASSDYGCEIDSSLLSGTDPEELDIEALREAGFIGFLPMLPPTWLVPTDFLDALPEADRLEGTFAMTYITAFPEWEEGEEPDEDAFEIAYKRVPVSLAATPNHNPALVGWSVDGYEVESGATVRLDPGQAYSIEVTLADDAVESYVFRNESGVDETRTEEPYLSWYLQEGSFDQTNTLYPFTAVTYFAPESPSVAGQSLWVVVRDRRGGMGWSSLNLSFDEVTE
jgi:hypothetical protein